MLVVGPDWPPIDNGGSPFLNKLYRRRVCLVGQERLTRLDRALLARAKDGNDG